MKLVLLGTGGFMPTDEAQTACFMLPEVGVLLDAGTGLYRMPRYLQTPELDVYITHSHGDHTRGLVFLFASFFVDAVQRSVEPLNESNVEDFLATANQRLHSARIHATQSTIDFLAKEYEPFHMDFHLLKDEESLPCGGKLTSFGVGHAEEVGFRLDWPGHSLAYVTDTSARPDSPYIEMIRGVDLLVHECNGPDRTAGLMLMINHSYTAAVAQVAAQAQVGRLILVHKNPLRWSLEEDLEGARAIFPFIEVGEDGMEIEF